MKKKSKIWNIVLLGLVIVAAVFGIVFNQVNSHKDNVKADDKQEVLTVGVTGTSFPTAYKSDNKLTGFDVDVIQAAAKKAGYKVKFVTGEFDGLLGQLDNGKLDTVANDIAITPARQQKYQFSHVYNKEETTVAVQKSSGLKDLKDLEGKTVAGASASNNTQNLQNYDSKINIKMYDARDVTFQALLAGHVDGVVNTRNNLEALIKAQHYPWTVLKGSAATVKIALPFSKNEEGNKKLKKLNPAIDELKKDGTLKKLSEKYFGYDATSNLN